MKTSIKKLLSGIQFNLVLLLLIVVGVGLAALSSQAVFERIDNIATQEKLANKLLTLDRNDLKFSQIESDGILKQLPILIGMTAERAPYEFVDRIISVQTRQDEKRIRQLRLRYDALAKAAASYFGSTAKPVARRAALQEKINEYTLSLHHLLSAQTAVLKQYRMLMVWGLGIIFLWALFLFAAVRRSSKIILGDIAALTRQEGTSRSSYKYQTTEMNTIALKLRQNGGDTLAPARQDPVTQLLNYDGIKKAYEQRFSKVKSSNIFLCVFEIDNFSKLANHYPPSVIEPILLKISSIMKLHQQQNDLLARIGDGRFLAIFVRVDKQKAFNDFDHIRQMVEDNRFKLPHATIPITLSGGFTPKTSSQTLDDALKNATDYLKIAQGKGGNVIADIRDNSKVI